MTLSRNEFIARSIDRYGAKFDYSFTTYVNTFTKVTLICNTCANRFEVVPKYHFSKVTGTGCPECNKRIANRANTTGEIVESKSAEAKRDRVARKRLEHRVKVAQQANLKAEHKDAIAKAKYEQELKDAAAKRKVEQREERAATCARSRKVRELLEQAKANKKNDWF